jgi:hypothetical protein
MLTYTFLQLVRRLPHDLPRPVARMFLHIYQIFGQVGDLQSRSATPRLICRLQPVVFPDDPKD